MALGKASVVWSETLVSLRNLDFCRPWSLAESKEIGFGGPSPARTEPALRSKARIVDLKVSIGRLYLAASFHTNPISGANPQNIIGKAWVGLFKVIPKFQVSKG